MSIFLNAKHWQIFLMLIIPLVCVTVLRSSLTPLQLGFMWMLLLLVICSWLYSIGNAANERLSESLKKNRVIFMIAVAMPLVYMALFFILIIIPLNQQVEALQPPGWMIVIHFAALAGFMYALWFAAKQLVTLEKGEPVFYIEYAFVLLGLWFGFIGVWFLQPRVNKLLSDTPSE